MRQPCPHHSVCNGGYGRLRCTRCDRIVTRHGFLEGRYWTAQERDAYVPSDAESAAAWDRIAQARGSGSL